MTLLDIPNFSPIFSIVPNMNLEKCFTIVMNHLFNHDALREYLKTQIELHEIDVAQSKEAERSKKREQIRKLQNELGV